MKLAKELKKIRNEKFLSLADVAEKVEVTRATVWKLEQGSLPKGENFENIITKGLGIKKGTKQYKELIGLWTAERLGSTTMSDEVLSSKIEGHENELNSDAEELIALLNELSPSEMEQIKLAMERPQVLEALATLNELYAA